MVVTSHAQETSLSSQLITTLPSSPTYRWLYLTSCLLLCSLFLFVKLDHDLFSFRIITIGWSGKKMSWENEMLWKMSTSGLAGMFCQLCSCWLVCRLNNYYDAMYTCSLLLQVYFAKSHIYYAMYTYSFGPMGAVRQPIFKTP